MKRVGKVVSFSLKLIASAVMMTAGVVGGAALAAALGLELPVVEGQDGSQTGLLLLLAGGLALSSGLVAMNAGMTVGRRERYFVLALFAFVVNGLGNLLEGSIFTTIGGELAILSIRLTSTLLCAAAVVMLFARPAREGFAERASSWYRRSSSSGLAARLGLAVVAFPLIYLTVGVTIAPIVKPYYEEIAFLVVPPFGTLLVVLVIRSALLLLASLPVIVAWSGTRRGLVLALGWGHFVAVGLTDLIQASFLPDVLRLIHGAEILVDSIAYALVLTWLFVPQRKGAEEGTPVLQRQSA